MTVPIAARIVLFAALYVFCPSASLAAAELDVLESTEFSCETHVLQRTLGPRQSYTIEYPRCGLEKIDALFRHDVEDTARILHEEYRARVNDGEDPNEFILELEQTYELYSPSPRFLSIVYKEWNEEGAVHGRPAFGSRTVNIETGKTILLADVFYDWDKANEVLPTLIQEAYEEDGCDVKDLEVEVNFSGLSGDDRDIFYLDEEGLGFYFAFFGTHRWTCESVLIKKEKLLPIGAKPGFWIPNSR